MFLGGVTSGGVLSSVALVIYRRSIVLCVWNYYHEGLISVGGGGILCGLRYLPIPPANFQMGVSIDYVH